MEWHNEKLLPVGLPELAYQVTPAEIADRLRVVALPKRENNKGSIASIEHGQETFTMRIYPYAVMNNARRYLYGVSSTAAWVEFLFTYLHEVGHVVARLDGRRDPGDAARYRRDLEYRFWVERAADAWAEEALAKIAARHPYLGQPQPGRLGNYPGKTLLKAARNAFQLRSAGAKPGEDMSGVAYSETLASVRAAKVGGQITLAAAARALGKKPEAVRKACRRLGIGRDYVDGAGRRHTFLAWWEFRLLVEL